MNPAAPSRSAFADMDVIVDPLLEVDAGWAGRALVLRHPGQTHENAVERLVEMFPAEHVDDINRLVRTHMPDAPSVDDLAMQLGASTPTWVTGPAETPSPGMSRRRLRVMAGLIGLGVGLGSVGVYALLSNMNETPFDEPQFTALAYEAHFDCRVLSDSTASCLNVPDQTTWLVTAREGVASSPDSYRFTHADQVAVVWIFPSMQEREQSPEVAGLERSYPFTTARDRVSLGATDAPVLAHLAQALDKSVLRENHGVSGLTPATNAPRGTPLENWPSPPASAPVPWPASEKATARPTRAPGAASTPSPSSTTSTPPPSTGTPAPTDAPTADAGRAAPQADLPGPDVSVSVDVPAVGS